MDRFKELTVPMQVEYQDIRWALTRSARGG